MSSISAGNFTAHETAIEGLKIIEKRSFGDTRGYFIENYRADMFKLLGIDFTPVQANASRNNTLVARCFHGEPWDKLCSVSIGTVYAGIVDARAGCDTFGKFEGFNLDEELSLFVPEGCLNSYMTTTPAKPGESPLTVYSYLVSGYYDPAMAGIYPAVALDDPEIAAPWPISLDDVETAPKDRSSKTLADIREAGGLVVKVTNT